MKIALSYLVSLLLLIGCDDDGIEGNGHVVEETRAPISVVSSAVQRSATCP